MVDRDELRTLARALSDALAYHVRRFFDRAKSFVREAIVAGAMILGGPEPLDADDLAEAERQAVVQSQYLDRFEREAHYRTPEEIAEGEAAVAPMTAPQFIARAELYGNSPWSAAQNVARLHILKNGLATRERRVHTRPPGHHECKTCIQQSGLGWQAPGALLPIGDSECQGNCDCVYEYMGHDGKVFRMRRAA